MKFCEEPQFVEIFERPEDFVLSGLKVVEIEGR